MQPKRLQGNEINNIHREVVLWTASWN